MNKKANPINTDVTVMVVVFNGFGASKSTVAPGGGGVDGILLSSAGSNWANWSVMLRLN